MSGWRWLLVSALLLGACSRTSSNRDSPAGTRAIPVGTVAAVSASDSLTTVSTRAVSSSPPSTATPTAVSGLTRRHAVASAELSRPVDAELYSNPPVEVLITRDDRTLPANCRPWHVAGLITTFFEAFNRGDQKRLSSIFFASAPRGGSPSRWYSVAEGDPTKGGRGFVAHDVDELLSYFAERHRHQERLRLLMVAVGTSSGGGVDFEYALTRSADDIEPGPEGRERNAHGKGAMNCREQKIRFWSMGMPEADDKESSIVYWPPCPKPRNWRPGTAVIACTRLR